MHFLTPEELYELTHRKQKTSQRTALNQMGIEYKVRPDGSIAVLKSHIEKVMGGNVEVNQKRRTEPNWEAMRI